ncbi:hypothetical protein [Puniceicoccus vermicola]|uniref:PEP-CTERM sorting domain-containing protein n=1 Tax=Puniceicoccus vermicola TaxID=388746 RepID=A0A7X1E5T7_9BACT|nr:hypothetical protein [Puniceicoccus vermicola]MBC2603408.1 hypothetical protein [Puniceicoccus vermicola]
MKTSVAFRLASLGLFCSSAGAAITLEYNNSTGAYAISGTAAGPGSNRGSLIAFDWDWGYDLSFANEVHAIFIAVVGDEGISGTVGGTSFVADSAYYDSSEAYFVGFSYTTPEETGSLVLNSTSGFVSAGLWSSGDGTFTGNPGYSTDSFILEVGAVPEPSTFGAIAGLAALVLTLAHRRRMK